MTAPSDSNRFGAGRFAPSPTGPLHLGNLRTALIAWVSARAQGLGFLVRMEDLDRVTSSRQNEHLQLADLAAIGLDWDGMVVRQSDRFDRYDAAIAALAERGLTYECYCTRREIREASQAPHGDDPSEGTYPGTCRSLTPAGVDELRRQGRQPAIRLSAGDQRVDVDDELLGTISRRVDDVVLRRNDGVPAYNLAVVVDDAAQHVDEVVRGDDLVPTTPRQVLLQRLLGLATPRYRHVPLVVGGDGVRLAKRHGAVTLGDLRALGIDPPSVLSMLATSLQLAATGEVVSTEQLVRRFDPSALPREAWTLPANLQRSVS